LFKQDIVHIPHMHCSAPQSASELQGVSHSSVLDGGAELLGEIVGSVAG
jgi:hypothetical protein